MDKEKNYKYVICDIDGTVADNNHRQHLLGKSRNWEAFFNEMENDQPINNVLEMVKKKYEDGFQIIFLTGRPERYRSITKKWLEKYIYFEFCLVMRKDNDTRNKVLVKKELFKENFSDLQIECFIENDLDLLKLWENMKLAKVINANEYF